MSGTAEAGSTVTVTDAAGNELGSVTVGEDGSFSVPLSPALTNGETVTAVVTDTAGNSSEPVTATAPNTSVPDTTAPDAPVASVSEDGQTVSGTAEAGSTVQITLPDGTVLSASADAFGVYSIALPEALTNGESVTATATDAAGNVSEATTVTAPDTTAPAVPTATVSEDGASVSGTAEAGSTVTVTDAEGNELGSVTVGEDGTYSVPLSPALTNGETVTAVVTDTAGNSSEPVTATAPNTSVPDTTAPDAPVASVSEDGQTVSGTAEAGSTVQITLPDGTVLSASADAFGVYSIALPEALTNGESVTATATDAAGNVSEATTVTAPDTTAPAVPTATVSEDGAFVSGTAEAGSTVTVTDAEGNELGSVTVGEDGSFSVPLSPALTNGESVTATATDAAGNVSEATTATAPDTTAPAVPTATVSEDGASVSGTAEAGSTVTVTDGAGNELGSVTVGEDGSFSVPLSPALTNGESVTATATDAAGNLSEAITATAPDTTAPAVPTATVSEDGAFVSGTAEAGSTVTITDGAGNELGSVTVGEDGTFSVPLSPVPAAGDALTVTATDAAGNMSGPATATVPDTSVPDTTAPDAPVASISENGQSVSGTAEAGSTVHITLPDGTVLSASADAFGVYSIALPVALTNGESVTVTATDAAGNMSEATTATAPDTTAPAVPGQLTVSEDGSSVSGWGEAGSTVTITDATGNELGSVTVGEDGSFSVPLSPALTNGESVTATATDAAGNSSGPATATAPDTTAPDAPTATVSEDGGSVSGTAEAGSTVTITLADGTTATAQADSNGSYSYAFPQVQANGETISVSATDIAGNVSASTTVTAPVLSLAANDNDVVLDLSADSATTVESLSDWGFLIVGALGDIVSLLGDDSAQVTFTVDSNATADVVLEASATGSVLSLLNTMGVTVQQYNAQTSAWNTVADSSDPQWASVFTIGRSGVSLNLDNLGEGTYRALAYNTTLLAVGSFTSLTATVTQTAAGVVSGETLYTGNVITDEDPVHGADTVPANAVVTQVVNHAGDVVSVTADDTVIEGEYGTLTIDLDGSYTYTLTETSTAVLGQTDSFAYTLSAGALTTSANLTISLGAEPQAPGNVVAVDDEVAITFDTSVDSIDNGPSSQSGFTVLNLGLGNVLNVGILDDLTDPIIFDIEEGSSRTMTLQASAAGGSVVSGFDLYIYKFNDATQQYDQYRVVDSWLQVLLVGGTSEALTLTLEGGRYLFLMDTAYGLTAFTRYTLNILEDHIYSVETVSTSVSGNVMQDDTAPSGSIISAVNGVAIAADGMTSVTGSYGVLAIDAQGNYTYTLNNGVGADGITAPDSFVYTLTAPDGESDVGSLNITLTPSSLAAIEDSVTLPVTAVQEETSYSDTDVGTTSWSSSLFSSTSGNGSGTLTVADNSALKDATITFNVGSSLNLGGLSISWALLNSEGTQLASGSVASGTLLGGTATASLGDLELAAGDYTLNFTGSIGALSLGTITVSASVTGTSQLLDSFQTDSATAEGNIFDGSGSADNAADQLVSVQTKVSVTDVNGQITTLDPYITSDATASVQGRYGTLTLDSNGDYRYSLSNDVDISTITQKETFDYTLTALSGETASSTLTIDLTPQLDGSIHSDIATSTAYDDTFALGLGADTLIFNLLDSADATGGNGKDTWTDFSLAEGDKVDISQLLEGWDAGTGNLGDWLSVETVNGNTVIAIDRDGQGSAFTSTDLVSLQTTQITLDELMENNAIIA
ncbi:BapA/Bap/LapF family large adhesin [Samsonia erythrinae]|uniref:BapA/Bap/LapF family large adhesin n=1 Tax=Samsonia erythrinae TaxID=160434 RepID=UPI0035E5E318